MLAVGAVLTNTDVIAAADALLILKPILLLGLVLIVAVGVPNDVVEGFWLLSSLSWNQIT